MKALILKDLYQLKAYCKSLLLIVGVFTLVIPFSDGNLFFCIYPVMMISMLPMTLLSYDERTKWNCYCAALPFRRSQIVTAKYLLCLLLTLPMALLVLGLSAIRVAVSGSGQWSALAVLAVSLLVMSTLSSSLSKNKLHSLVIDIMIDSPSSIRSSSHASHEIVRIVATDFLQQLFLYFL